MTSGTVQGGPLPSQPRANGTWSPSAGLEGIDALHSYVTDRRVTAPFGPSSATDQQGFIGGTEDSIPTRGPSHTRQGRQAVDPKGRDQSVNQARVDNYRMEQNQTVENLASGYGDITRPRDPRNFSIPVERPTAHEGPTMGYTQRTGPQLWGRFRSAVFDGNHASFAFPSTFRPIGQQGDGQGRKRFRPTTRVTPQPLASQITNTEMGDNGSGIIFQRGSIPKYW